MAYYHDDPLEPQEPKSRNYLNFFGLIIAAIVAGLFVQNTLAANVSLGSAPTTEFGQGFTQTVACSGSTPLTITPASSFVNTSGAGSYYISAVKVSNIPSGCNGVDFTLNAFGTSGNAPLALFNSTSTNAVVYNNAGNFQGGIGATGLTITSSSGSFTITFDSPIATTSSISSMSLQSGAHILTCVEGGVCRLGDSGPGGGTIFMIKGSLGGQGGAFNYEAWTADLSGSVMNWNNVNGVLGVGSAIGDGYTNRTLFTGGAGAGCKNANYNSLTDWFLPSSGELTQLRSYWGSTGKTLPIAMRDTGYGYWSSSENGANYAVAIRWNDGMLYGDAYAGKTSPVNTGWARCVRRF
jgi:hypothetical protein